MEFMFFFSVPSLAYDIWFHNSVCQLLCVYSSEFNFSTTKSIKCNVLLRLKWCFPIFLVFDPPKQTECVVSVFLGSCQ